VSDFDLSDYLALVTTNYPLVSLPPKGSLLEIVSRDARGDVVALWDGREISLPYDHYQLKAKVEPPDTAAAKLYLKRKKELEKLRAEAPELLSRAVREFRAGIESLKKSGAQIELVPDEELTLREQDAEHSVWFCLGGGVVRGMMAWLRAEVGEVWWFDCTSQCFTYEDCKTSAVLLRLAEECATCEVPIGAL
jgi:hypothetical protein